jgi:DNA-binding winged helix-turn-helix (wHTH) protein
VFELNVTTEELRKSGTLIRLAPQPLKLLELLARRSGQVVTREEIQSTLWGGKTYVDFEQGMNHCIKQIRNALSDSADTPLYIETLPRRGYRFLAPVVTKRIPAPPPRVVESTSGIQTSAIPAGLPVSGPSPAPVVRDPTAALRAQHPAAAASQQELPMPVEPKPEPKSVPLKIILVAGLLLAAAIVAWVYWRTRKAAYLEEKRTVVVAELEDTAGELRQRGLPVGACWQPAFSAAVRQHAEPGAPATEAPSPVRGHRGETIVV